MDELLPFDSYAIDKKFGRHMFIKSWGTPTLRLCYVSIGQRNMSYIRPLSSTNGDFDEKMFNTNHPCHENTSS